MSTHADQGYAPNDIQSDVINAISVEVSGPKSYDQLDDEPVEWYLRFQAFCFAGPGRSLQRIYQDEWLRRAGKSRQEAEMAGLQLPTDVSGAWKEMVKRWDWYNRAAAYDLECKEANLKAATEALAKRREIVIEKGWAEAETMRDMAMESLKHGNKFFERSTRVIQGKWITTWEDEVDRHGNPTGRKVKVKMRVDREVVYIEHRLGDINRMLMDADKKARASVGMTSEKAMTEHLSQATSGESLDELNASIERDLKALGLWRDPKSNAVEGRSLKAMAVDDDDEEAALDDDPSQRSHVPALPPASNPQT